MNALDVLETTRLEREFYRWCTLSLLLALFMLGSERRRQRRRPPPVVLIVTR